jgi:hypothetical protein
VGDQVLPADQRHTFLMVPAVNRDTPLLPAGLLGPVTIRTMQVVRLNSVDPANGAQQINGLAANPLDRLQMTIP